MGCRYTGAAKGDVFCAWTQNGRTQFTTRLTLSVNDGEGWGGPGSASMSDPVTIRRLANPAGSPIGLVLSKNMPSETMENLTALEAVLDEATAELNR